MAGVPKPRTVSTKQARIAQLAKQMPDEALHSVSHHMDLDWLREAYRRTRKDGAAGVDGQSADTFAEDLEGNLQSLLDQAKSGVYRAPPVRRVYIPKGDGTKVRPIGIPTFGDKVLQRAVKMLLEPIYEQAFCDLSYGFRPGRSTHDALAHLNEELWAMGGGWVLDVDVSGFFDAMRKDVVRDLLGQRVKDGVVTRLVGKWLRAGVLEAGVVSHPETGSPQGGVISPLLSNLYLHEVFDTWWVRDVLPRMRGRAVAIRYADDLVLAFADERDARRVHAVLAQRFERYGLSLHPEKTRLVRYMRPGAGRPEPGSFDFLGFTHYWTRSRRGNWVMKRKTAKDRFSRALTTMNQWMKKARHVPLPEQVRQLNEKLRGHYEAYGIPWNSASISRFSHEVKGLWRKWLARRSQRGLTWATFKRLLARYPPLPPRLPPKPRQVALPWAKL
ncbi:MAG: RNA-directed DNA polymerase [Myxococcota bacterium]|jgi:RNA-directed DNA polymerase